MELSYFTADNKSVNFKWICNYSFLALKEKFLAATGRKNIKNTKLFLEWCCDQGFLEKVKLKD